MSHSDPTKATKLSYEKMRDKVLDEMKKTFRPEFLNRIDGTVVFHALTKKDIRKIVELMLSQVQGQLKEKDLRIAASKGARDYLGEKGYDRDFGARPLRRLIEREVEDPLSDALLKGKFHPGETIKLYYQDGKIVLKSLGEALSEGLLQKELHERIVGQEKAINDIDEAIIRAQAVFKGHKRPVSFAFLGPAGVGKTEMAKGLAEFMLGRDETLVKVDMSKFVEKDSIARLIVTPPGNVGNGEGELLTEAVRREPYSAILLDEIDKAHPDVFNILSQIYNDGHLTDAKGVRVDFRNTIIIMTSKEKVFDEMKKTFRPEFLNHIDGTAVFHALTKEHIRKIVERKLSQLSGQLEEQDIKLEVTDAVKDYLAEKGYDPAFGARPLGRIIERLEEALPSGEFSSGKPIVIDCQDNEDGEQIALKQDDKIVLVKIVPQSVAVAGCSA
jgi:ATP-dependent Clp protease ATP-binding subunit ClpC